MDTLKSYRRSKKVCSIGSCGVFLLLVASGSFVEGLPTWTKKPSSPYEVSEGSTATLNWTYSLNGTFRQATLTKVGDGGGIVVDKVLTTPPTVSAAYEDRLHVQISDTQTSLTIVAIPRSDSGAYEYKVVNNNLQEIKHEVTISVLFPAKLTNVSDDQTVREGSNITLACEATARPPPSISWIKVLEGGSNSEVLHHGPTWNFPNISRSDSGTYRCTANSGFGNPVSHKVKVNVTYPAKIVKLPGEYNVSAQDSLSLHCEAEGYPQPTYTWTPCEPQASVCDKSTLKFPETRNNSVYMYTCEVKNSLGNDTRNTSVFIASNVINVTLVITSESCTDGKYDKGLWKKLSEKVNEVFADESLGYESAQLKEIRCGSVIVDLALKFKSTVREIEVLSILRDAVKNGSLGDFNVSAITGTRHDTETTTTATTPTSPSASKTWIIVVAVLVPLFVLFVVAGVVAWCVYNKRKCKKKDTKVHNESQVQATDDVRGEYATVNQGTKGKKEVVQEKPPVSYAVVDKTRKKKREKKPQPGELQYAELGEFSRAEGMPRTSASRGSYPTETQYADVSGM